jgi:F0F1-type ATP synthase gamma subunit
MGDLNNRIIRFALGEQAKYKDSVMIAVGRKGAAKLASPGLAMKTFADIEETGLYNTAIHIKDYLIEEVMNGRLGKAIVVLGSYVVAVFCFIYITLIGWPFLFALGNKRQCAQKAYNA